MKSNYILYFLASITIFCASCSSSGNFREDVDAYTVNVSTLNVRQHTSINANILGKLKMGDTVYTKESFKNWRKILYNGQIAYVDSAYLKKIEDNQQLYCNEVSTIVKTIFQLVDKYAYWKSWKFWLITVVMWFISSFLFKKGNRLLYGDDAVDYWVDHGFMGMNFLPYVAILVGFLFGFVYFFWTEDVQRALFIDHFWWFPAGKGFLYWYLWFLGFITLGSIFIFSIYDIITFKAFSIVRIIYFLISSSVIFICMIFFASASIIILLVILAIDIIVSTLLS